LLFGRVFVPLQLFSFLWMIFQAARYGEKAKSAEGVNWGAYDFENY
jgi:hypothetical protein